MRELQDRTAGRAPAGRSILRGRSRIATRAAVLLAAVSLIPMTLLTPPAAAQGARYLGSVADSQLQRPIVGMAPTPSGDGYWLVASDGGVFSFGDARFHGSTGGIALSRPIVAMAPTPSGEGYWLVASDGGIFAFGDARFHGSTGGISLSRPIVAMAATRTGAGYWLIASDGGIFTFGDARFYGSAAGQAAMATVASMAPSPRGGYWMVTADGAVFTATPSGGFTSDPNLIARSPETAISQDLFHRINDERAARGLRTLTWDPVLADLAADWARQMAAVSRMYHQDLQGLFGNPLVAGRFVSLRENIYTGNGSYRDSGSAHVAFMHSDPHRADILVDGLTSIGVGAACVNGTLWVTEDFGVLSGNPVPASAPIPPVDPIVQPDENGSSCH